MSSPTSLVDLLTAAEAGSKPAADILFHTLYAELRRLAKFELARHGAPVSVSATTLLHQAYIEMAARDAVRFDDRGRFMAYAARVMRGLIIDHVRSRQALKRGGQYELTSIDSDVECAADDRTLTRISEALDELARAEPALAEIVDLKFFCGFSFTEIGAMRGVCERTVQRQWEKARIYLHRKVQNDLQI